MKEKRLGSTVCQLSDQEVLGLSEDRSLRERLLVDAPYYTLEFSTRPSVQKRPRSILLRQHVLMLSSHRTGDSSRPNLFDGTVWARRDV